MSSLGLIDARTNYGSNISNSASENEQPVLTYRRIKFTNRKHTSVKIIVVFKIFHRCLFATWIKPFGSDLCISISCSVDGGFEQVSAKSFVTGHIILPSNIKKPLEIWSSVSTNDTPSFHEFS